MLLRKLNLWASKMIYHKNPDIGSLLSRPYESLQVMWAKILWPDINMCFGSTFKCVGL